MCYIGLYHRKSILSFSILHWKRYVSGKCVFRNVNTISNNQPSLYHNDFDQAAEGLDVESDVDLFFLWKDQHKCETRWESTVKLWFSDDIVIKLATFLTMSYIWDLTYLS